MKEIQLSKNGKKYRHLNICALVDDADFEWLNQWSWNVRKTKYGVCYAMGSIIENGKRRNTSMHRLILGITDPEIYGDHIDRNTLNNQRNNLRAVTFQQNRWNRSPTKNSTSKYIGVCLEKKTGSWVARITVNNKDKYIGLFKSEDEAALAYNQEAIKLRGEFASLNPVNKAL